MTAAPSAPKTAINAPLSNLPAELGFTVEDACVPVDELVPFDASVAAPGMVLFPLPMPVSALVAVTLKELPARTVNPALLITFTALKFDLVIASLASVAMELVVEVELVVAWVEFPTPEVSKRSCVYL